MKHLLFFFILIIAAGKAIGQLPVPRVIQPPKNFGKREHYDAQVIMTDGQGRPFKNPYIGIEGSPFLSDTWSQAFLITKSNAAFDSVKVRIDIYKQELHYLSKKNEEMVTDPGFISDVWMKDAVTGEILHFRCGFPKSDNQDENNYYRVLSDGRIPLLKSTRKVISVNKNDVAGEVEKKFTTYDDTYIFYLDEMKRFKKDKNFILQLMLDQQDAVQTFLKSNPTNFKNMAEVVKLFDYYNSL